MQKKLSFMMRNTTKFSLLITILCYLIFLRQNTAENSNGIRIKEIPNKQFIQGMIYEQENFNSSYGNSDQSNFKINKNYIMRVAYINTMKNWWGPSIISESFGLNSCYDVIILTFWLSNYGAFDALRLYENIYASLGTDEFGKSNQDVQKTILDLFHEKGKLLFISAFGGSDFPTSKNPVETADRLAEWVKKNPYIDGIDLDYEDNNSILNGLGVDWIINFHKQLKKRIDSHYLITHAPQASYFSKVYYQGGGYFKVNQEIGHLIDWYNIQFFNQGMNQYNSFQTLFIQSAQPFVGTSYKEIIENNQIPNDKIIIGKPASPQDCVNGYLNPNEFGSMINRAESILGKSIKGFFIWKLNIQNTCEYANSFQAGYNTHPSANNNSELMINNLSYCLDHNCVPQNQKAYQQKRENIKSIAYINKVSSWWGPSVIDSFGGNSCYDILIITYWLSSIGPTDVALLYQDIYKYLGTDQFGKNNLEVQSFIKDQFNKNGKLLMISAFGDSDYPTSQDPFKVASDFANFVNSLPYLDGIDINYEDTNAIENGTGIAWLVTFTKVLREKLINKNMILTHSPQAPYFSKQFSSGGYYQIHQQVGDLIDWYNIQFYNQGDNSYDTFQTLFIQSGKWFEGTSFTEIMNIDGIPLNKLVIGKPATKNDVMNSGYIDPYLFGQIVKQAYNDLGLNLNGFFIWQLSSDSNCIFKTQFLMGYNS